MKTAFVILCCIGNILSACQFDTSSANAENTAQGHLYMTAQQMYIKDYLNNPDTVITNGNNSVPVKMSFLENKIYTLTPDGCETPFRIINDTQIAFDTAYSPLKNNPSVDFVCFIDRRIGTYHYEGEQMIIVFEEGHSERPYRARNGAPLDYQITRQWDTIRVTVQEGIIPKRK